MNDLISFTRISEDSLQGGEVMIVEPSVYVIGSGGIRIEDCGLVVRGDGGRGFGARPQRSTVRAVSVRR